MRLFVFLMVFAAFLFGDALVKIEAIKGSVKIKQAHKIVKQKAKKGMQLYPEDLLITSHDGVAKLRLEDNSTLIVDKDSIVTLLSQDAIEQSKGRVFYKITHKKAGHRLQVKTDFAIIGIKGTTFIVKATQYKEVLLQEGVVGIQSIKGAFELYRAKVQAEFDAYKSGQEKGFEHYKNSYKEPVVTKAFDLQANNKVRFDAQKVKEDRFGEDEKRAFEYFKQLSDAL